MAKSLAELLGDGARADGFDELSRFLDGIQAQNPTDLPASELSFIRMLKIMTTAATEASHQESVRHGRPVPEIAAAVCRAAGFAITSAVLSVHDRDADLKQLRAAVMRSVAMGVDYMIDHTRKARRS